MKIGAKKVLIAGFGSVAERLVSILPNELYQVTGIRRSEVPSPSASLNFSSALVKPIQASAELKPIQASAELKPIQASALPKPIQASAELIQVKADLNDIQSLSPIAKEKFDHLIYCPSPDKRDEENYRKTYLQGLRNILQLDEIIANLKRFIFISSTGVYGQSEGEWVDEETPANPQTFSGKIILEAENFLSAQNLNDFTILRLGGIYGKKKSRFLEQIKNKTISLNGSSLRYINRIHIRDCAGIIKHLMELEKPERLYLGVDDDPADQKEVILWLAKRLGVSLPEKYFQKEEIDSSQIAKTSNKRCQNERIKKSGYEFIYPDYKKGYNLSFKNRG